MSISYLMSHMRITAFQRRRTGMILLATGSLPFIVTTMVILIAFLQPSIFRDVFGLFVPAGVDAPDNWAVAITRMVRLFTVSCGIGVAIAGAGLWLSRRAGQTITARDS